MRVVLTFIFLFSSILYYSQENSKKGVVTIRKKVYQIHELSTFPSYTGGEEAMCKFLYSNIKYPTCISFTGTIYCEFIINEKGEVKEPIILKPINPIVDKNIIEAIKKMPNWIPGKYNNKHVSCKFILPIKFTFE